MFRAKCMNKSLSHIGCNIESCLTFSANPEQAARLVDQHLKAHNIAISNYTLETRPEMPPGDQGIYIYKDNVLLYFISLIYNNRAGDSYDIETNSEV